MNDVQNTHESAVINYLIIYSLFSSVQIPELSTYLTGKNFNREKNILQSNLVFLFIFGKGLFRPAIYGHK
jgi:hypothetical protein